jgi:hypothetical protein
MPLVFFGRFRFVSIRATAMPSFHKKAYQHVFMVIYITDIENAGLINDPL